MHSQLISIDTAKPTSSILCDGAACQPSYDHAVQATLSGSDTGGSGLKNIRYTTDGSNPTSSSPVYSAAIPVELDHHDQVARRGQRRQRRVAGPHADDHDLDRRRAADQRDPL